MSNPRCLKCRFCGWRAWGIGGYATAWGRVQHHIASAHPSEWIRFSGEDELQGRDQMENVRDFCNADELELVSQGAQWRRESTSLPKAAELIFGE